MGLAPDGPRCAFAELCTQELIKCHGIKPELQGRLSGWPSQDLTFASCRGRGCRLELQKMGRSISTGQVQVIVGTVVVPPLLVENKGKM